MKTERCDFCKADFRIDAIKNNKCAECEKDYPGVATMKEWKEQQQPEFKANELALKGTVTKIVNNILEELGILSECDCGKLYFKRSPAKKTCGNCEETE